MANLEGIVMKYTVVKNEDIGQALTERGQDNFQELLDIIMMYRKQELEKGENTYLVINTDEPYADQIIDIMKSYGHWGLEGAK